MTNAIEVDDVSKRFRLSTDHHDSIKERVVQFGRRSPRREFWALRDIAFDVPEGSTIGLLGHNGSGKSTLLKCIGGILRPTTGEIRRRGRLASLLELGAGFHPDLTGRENVYLNASILGLSKRDIDVRFDDIVGFAELENFIDQQVKHYSSGMYVRLGFSVAINVDPEILLIDEVLAVGDENFQRKCLDRIKQFQRDGVTIAFVTHAPDLVRQICDMAVVLDEGVQVTHAKPSEAVRLFREHLLSRAGQRLEEMEPGGEHGEVVRITDVVIEYPHADESYVRNGEAVTLRVSYEAKRRVDDVVFAFALHANDGHVVFGQNTWGLGEQVDLEGKGEIAFELQSVHLLEGTYPLTVNVHARQGSEMYDTRDQLEHVDVLNQEGNFAWGVADIPVKLDLSKGGRARGPTPPRSTCTRSSARSTRRSGPAGP
ncbi:MAG: transporter ATP-binding protein [Actinomycetia bacterium]|nr:transporter ATP-binding protein [Actinomycetes bacterium]